MKILKYVPYVGIHEHGPTASTITLSLDERGYDWITKEVIDFVRDAVSEKDAVHNLGVIMKQYEARKTFLQKIKSLFI